MKNTTILVALLAKVEPRHRYTYSDLLEDQVKELSIAYPHLDIPSILEDESLMGNGQSIYSLLNQLGHFRSVVEEGPEGERLVLVEITEIASQVLQEIFETINSDGNDSI
ncbi:hypothetical protein TH63_13570 [Rufibacter radiotolerans]|uniref:Uncharacterized protein n=1 Tax=Rufibacter radiotolerans TaxID=1379910 RepID=A0A0H4VKU5_9BACT|nr:hypothetical protein [Rufibacter radiotolerans]AKQ46420.1 hypothetical protein TH63_13570 [Rufibacter radiotolerans]